MTEKELLTLTEVSERTGISMPTLGKYKRNHQERIPSVGEGRSQRYPIDALEVFEKIKRENLKKRGRRTVSRPEEEDGGDEELLPLTEIARRTNISYSTLRKYAEEHDEQIPSEGQGRRKRYHPEAVEVFQEIYGDGRPGPGKKSAPRRQAGGTLADRVHSLEQNQRELEHQIAELVDQLKKPLSVTIRP